MFTIVTDSSAYLTRQESKKLDVHVLPMFYAIDGMQFYEGPLDENGEYVKLIGQRGREQRTAQVSSTAFLSAFHELMRKGKDILCITISSRLSGTYSSAAIAARELDRNRVFVFDSLVTGAGMRFLVEAARKMSDAGLSPKEAMIRLEALRDKIGIALSVDDMGALRRSGRLGFVRQSVGTMLNVRPILFCKEGTVVSGAITRGRHGQIAELVRAIPEDAKRIVVQYVENKQAATMLYDAIRARFDCDIIITGIGPVLAIHLGLSAIGVAWYRPWEA